METIIITIEETLEPITMNIYEGVPGDSAYVVAVKNGFSGTQAEWLASLKGADGTGGGAWGGITGDITNQEDLQNALDVKVDVVAGKGLSTEDFTTEEKTKLDNVPTEFAPIDAEKNVNADWNATSGDTEILNKPTIPTKTSDLTNDSGYVNDISGKVDKESGKSLILDTEITRLSTVTNFDNSGNVTALANKVDKVSGKQLSTEDYSTAEKTKLAGIASGATANSSDATLLSRANHTGTQLSSTISDFASAVASLITTKVDKVNGYSLTKNDLTDALKIAYDGAASGLATLLATGSRLITSAEITKVASIDQSVSTAEKATWNGKQSALGFTPENVANKATDLTTLNNTLYPTTQAVSNAINNAVIGLSNYRGSYNASANLFPSTGGSGIAGAIKKADYYICSVAGTLGGVAVTSGDLIIALVDTPAQTSANWDLISHDINYVPEDTANKSTLTSDSGSSIKFPVWSAIVSYFNTSKIKTLLGQATTSVDGWLSATDWNTFNGKQNALGFTAVPNTRNVNSKPLSTDVTLVTDDIAESGTPTNKWWTNARTIASTLTGFSSGAGAVSSSDTILQAIQKIVGNIGALVTGVSSVNTKTGAVILTTADISDSTGKRYQSENQNTYNDATSSIQTQLNGKQASLGFTAVPTTRTINGYDLSSNRTLTLSDIGLNFTPYKFVATSQTAVTGSVSETIVASATINGGTFNATDILKFMFGANKPSGTSSVNMRLKINTTNSLSGATQIAIFAPTSTANVNLLSRSFSLNGGNLYGYPFALSSATDVVTIGGSLGSTAYNTANTLYLFFTVQLGTSSDSITPNLCNITN